MSFIQTSQSPSDSPSFAEVAQSAAGRVLALSEGEVPLESEWRLDEGETLLGGTLAYELAGAPDGPVVAVLGGISAGKHVTPNAADGSPGWWADIVGPGRAIDTDRYRVLTFDYLGGNGSSSGPRVPCGGLTAGSFPRVTTGDQARGLALLVDHLGIGSLHAVVGASYGGMVALAFAARYRERLERLFIACAAHQSHTQSTALRGLQRQIVRLGRGLGAAPEALALARGLAMVTYRSPEELEGRFGPFPRRAGGALEFPVEAYLRARGKAFARTFHPDAFLLLSESLDLHRVDPERIVTPTTLWAIASDQLVPLTQVRELRRRLGGSSRLVEVDSPYGHDAFLKESASLGSVLASCLAKNLGSNQELGGREVAR